MRTQNLLSTDNQPSLVCLDVLGASIAVPTALADEFADLHHSDAPPVAQVAAAPVDIALTELTALAVAHSPLFCVHAGVVSGADGLIAVPGHSGLGKTTLVAALVRAGFGYVSDEALAIDRSSLQAEPFARPLALNADVWHLLGPQVGPAPPPGTEQLVPVGALGQLGTGGPVAHIILAQRSAGPAQVQAGSRGDAVKALLSRSFNHYRWPEASFRCAVAVVRGAQVWQASYADAPDLAAELTARIRRPERTQAQSLS